MGIQSKGKEWRNGCDVISLIEGRCVESYLTWQWNDVSGFNVDEKGIKGERRKMWRQRCSAWLRYKGMCWMWHRIKLMLPVLMLTRMLLKGKDVTAEMFASPVVQRNARVWYDSDVNDVCVFVSVRHLISGKWRRNALDQNIRQWFESDTALKLCLFLQ